MLEVLFTFTNNKQTIDNKTKQNVIKSIVCFPNRANNNPPNVHPPNKNVWSTLAIRLLAFTLKFSFTIVLTIELLIGEKKPLKKDINANKINIKIKIVGFNSCKKSSNNPKSKTN
ncbi:hypothetical protein B1no1_14200 [Thermolongibacillus altinsuensis]|nr:hypothetical protein B1no1_14200 [Thermolongibacillus altinsuensis]